MIIYGSRNTQLKAAVVADKCPNCGTQNCIDMHVFQKYAHIYWIPLFPMSKTGVSQCDHCKQTLTLQEMSMPLAQSYEQLASETKTPIWTFAGAVFIVGCIIFGVISARNNDEKNAKLILAPQHGDVFEVKTKENQYTLYKVEQVQGDSVFVRLNDYETNTSSGLDDVKSKGDQAYSEDVFGFSKSEIKAMLDKGEIMNVDRK